MGYGAKYKCKVMAEQPAGSRNQGDGNFDISIIDGEDSFGEIFGFTPWTEVWCFDDETRSGRVKVGDVLWVCWKEEDSDDDDSDDDDDDDDEDDEVRAREELTTLTTLSMSSTTFPLALTPRSFLVAVLHGRL